MKSLPVENKCSRCPGSLCCTYVMQPVDTPRSKVDYQHLLWQVSHAGTEVVRDVDGWSLLIPGRCQHLLKNGLCGIYETRPDICRDHSPDSCELGVKKLHLDHFHDYDELLAYCRKRFKHWP